MRFEGFAYAFAVFGVMLGLAGLLAAEFFHGFDYLLTPGGALALVSVGAITVLIGMTEPPEGAESEH